MKIKNIQTQPVLTDQVKKILKDGAKALSRYKRRAFIAQTAIDYFDGNIYRTEREMSWGRNTIQLGLNELRTGIQCLNNYPTQSNKCTEEKDAKKITSAKKSAAFVEVESSRDKWKQRSLDAHYKIRLQRSRIQFLEESKEQVKQENVELKQRLSELKSNGVVENELKKNYNY